MIKVILYFYLKNKSNQTKPSRNITQPLPLSQTLELNLSQVVSVNQSIASSCYLLPGEYEDGVSWKSWLIEGGIANYHCVWQLLIAPAGVFHVFYLWMIGLKLKSRYATKGCRWVN